MTDPWKSSGPIPVYATEAFPTLVTRSIFLAGPTPRSEGGRPMETPSWRPEALRLLNETGFDGHVFIPEPRDGVFKATYDAQIEWETQALNRADIILFWIPRDMERLPGLTTNVEFGMWVDSGKVVFGAPPNAEKVRYLQRTAAKHGVPTFFTLAETLQAALQKIGDGMPRKGAEACVPLHIWKHPTFQQWYLSQTSAGNRLENARVLWSFWPPKAKAPFCWALHVEVFIASEGRTKVNEFVFGRTDISTVVLWRAGGDFLSSEVVLVREFRSPARTPDGMIRELPGGSAHQSTDPITVAMHEVAEETGLQLKQFRFRVHESRQLVGTLSAHTSSLFSVELLEEEMAIVKANAGKVFGMEEDSERTFVEVATVQDLLRYGLVDWATLGMVFSAIGSRTSML